MQPTLSVIGTIHSSLKNLDDCPRQENESAPAATIEIKPEYAQGIKDIEPGQEMLLLTWLHQADRTVLANHPRNNTQLPLTGVFSTRSPDRPNPIGLHIVQVLEITEDGLIKVDSLEALDQTPVLDIKPVLKR